LFCFLFELYSLLTPTFSIEPFKITAYVAMVKGDFCKSSLKATKNRRKVYLFFYVIFVEKITNLDYTISVIQYDILEDE
ncbi:MAG: hypothetical protein RR349_06465, partial [Oscillospiraceae bacterium]